MAGTITTGGLASGLDTNSIVDKLVQLESQPIALLQTQQAGVRSQVSALGGIASKLSALQAAAKSLADAGALGITTSSSNATFAAAPGSSATAGSYQVNVTQLATSARALSQAFTADQVRGGKLTLDMGEESYVVDIQDGSSLSDVAFAIRQKGAPVSATVLDDGRGNRYLSITALDSGYPPTGAPGDALAISFSAGAGATQGTAPAFAVTAARNAWLTVDGVTFERASNTVSDVIPGVTLTLKSPSAGAVPGADGDPPSGGTAETLTLANDTGGTQKKLQGFVDAYNALMAAIQSNLNPADSTDRSSTLAGSSSLRSLQSRIQALISSSATGRDTGIRSLADLGIKTGSDGTLSIDSETLGKALGKDAAAVNEIFSTASTGMSAALESLATTFTRPGDGLLTMQQDNLNRRIKEMDDTVADLQSRVAGYRELLVQQFAAMEQVVSQMQGLGSFLLNTFR
jgi:flagellar hook-associated protein 2